MKVFEVLTESKVIVAEALGTLAQLNAGPLINVIKQRAGGASRNGRYKSGPSISPDQSTFRVQSIGSESPIVDAGQIQSIADLRKAYRKAEKNEDAYVVGFALYINNIAVMLGIFEQYELGGATRVGAVAWDFTKFSTELQAVLEKMNQGKSNWSKVSVEPTTIQQKQERDYDQPWDYRGDAPTKTVNYTGTVQTTAELTQTIEIANLVAQETGSALGIKLILTDISGRKKRQSRQQLRYELQRTGDDLKTRVAKYKLSKRPTATNIKEFVDAVMAQKLKTIQFAGGAYALNADKYGSDIKAETLFSGKPFKLTYSSVVPGEYSSVYITYVMSDGRIVPVEASYTERTPDGKSIRVEEVIDPVVYASRVLKIKNPNDKETIVKHLLTLLKDSKLAELEKQLKLFRDLGNAWPELNVIEKSLNSELEKKKNQ